MFNNPHFPALRSSPPASPLRRLLRFGRTLRAGGRSGDKPEAFDFLGFTHYWGKSQKGNQVVMKKTAKGRPYPGSSRAAWVINLGGGWRDK